MGRRSDGKCSRCGQPHMRQSAHCAKCRAILDKERRAGNRPTYASQEASRDEKKEIFLTELIANGGHVQQACKKARISRTTAGDWRDADPDFAIQWEAIQEMNVERLEAEVDRRALGYETITRDGTGQVVKAVTTYSDNLLMFRLKALRPDKYRDGPRAGQINDLSNEELDAALQRMIVRRAKLTKGVDEITDSVN